MSFVLGERIHAKFNGEGNFAFGVVVATIEDGVVKFLNEEVRKRTDTQEYLENEYLCDDNDVLVLFYDDHMEWGYEGDGDFTSLEIKE